ncbi:MAG: TolC family protein [Aliiglaciecola sp.]|uniref:TolC family protein n=1 Tax=Aliiglaciecola sp. TaxID=1872441 RepID=UPI0032981A75
MLKIKQAVIIGCAMASFTISANTMFSLQDAINIAIERDHRVVSAQAQIESAETEIKGAQRGYYPNIQASAGSGDNFGSNSYEVRATQMLYDWGKVKQRVNTRTAEAEIQIQRYKLAEIEAAINATQAYLDISINQQYVTLYQAFHKNISYVHQIAEDRFNSSYSDSIETDRTKMEIARIEQAIALYQGEIEIAKQDFNELIGLSADNLTLQTPPLLPLNAHIKQQPQGLNSLIVEAPDYLLALAESKVARSDLALKEAERMPKINLEASWVRREIGGQWQSDSSVGIQIRYDGLDNWFQPKTARSKLKSAEYSSKAIYRDLIRAARSINLKQPSIQQRIESLKTQAQLALVVKSSYQQQFLAGMRDLEDLLSIEREIFEAKRQAIELSNQLISEQYMFASQLGILTQLLNKAGA